MSTCTDRHLIEQLAAGLTGPSLEERRLALLHQFAEESLPPKVMAQLAAHVEVCLDCRRGVDEFRSLPMLARSRETFTRAVCPGAPDLYAYLCDTPRLSVTQQQRISQHLERCELCREEVEWLRRLDTEDTSATPAPADPAASGVGRFRPRLLWWAVALVLAVGLVAPYRMKPPSPAGSNPYAHLVVYPMADYGELSAYRPADPALATEYDAAMRLCERGEYARAQRVLASLGRSLPNHPGVRFLIGYSAYQNGQAWEAFEHWCRAEELPPKSRQRCLFLLYLCLELGQPDRALLEVAEHPDDPEFRQIGERIKRIRSAFPIGNNHSELSVFFNDVDALNIYFLKLLLFILQGEG